MKLSHLMGSLDCFAQRNELSCCYICYIWNKTSCKNWCSTSITPPVPKASRKETLQSGCRIFQGFDQTQLPNSETLCTVEVYPVELCYMPQTKNGNVKFTPIMADVPQERLAFRSPTFSNTETDYFGRFFVSGKLSTQKWWGIIFTCLTTRTVHLEVVPSKVTSSYVMEIELLVVCCGVPGVLWSKISTNFIAIEGDFLNNVFNWIQQTLNDALVKKAIKWKFNPQSAPHHGGVWKRLVRSCKHTFYAILHNRWLADEILSSTICIVEQSLNAQSLVRGTADATVIDPLTPNHCLLRIAALSLPSLANCDFDHRKRHARAHAYSLTPTASGVGDYKNTFLRWTAEPNGLHPTIETSKLANLFERWSQLLREVTTELPVETWSVLLSNLLPFAPFAILIIKFFHQC